MQTLTPAQTFETYFLILLHSQDNGKYEKLQTIYQTALIRCIKVAFPYVEEAKASKVVGAVFQQFSRNNDCNSIGSSVRFEVLLTGLLFSEHTEKFYDGQIGNHVKANIRKQLNNITILRSALFATKEQVIRDTAETLKYIVPVPDKAYTIAEAAFDEIVFGVEFIETADGFPAFVQQAAYKLAKIKGYGRKPVQRSGYTDPCSPQIADVVTARTVLRWERLKKIKGKEATAKRKKAKKVETEKNKKLKYKEIDSRSKSGNHKRT